MRCLSYVTQSKTGTMHKFQTNPISIDDNLACVGKGLHKEQRDFFTAEKANLKNAFSDYDAHAVTNPVSLENLRPIWIADPADSAVQEKEKQEKRDKAYNLYGSNRPFVNRHWEALKKANGGKVLMCPICGLTECSEMDHYIPRSLYQEYSSHTSNLIPLCHECNHDKHEHWLNKGGVRYFFNAFYDRLPAAIIECIITINKGFPQVKVKQHSRLDKKDYYDAIVLRTIKKLNLLEKFQVAADMFMRSEIRRMKTDFSIWKKNGDGDRKAFWRSRIDAYNSYAKHTNDFNFIEIEFYKSMAVSSELKNWVEHSVEFVA